MNLLADKFLKSGNAFPRVAVVGDVMLDRYIHCEVVGISPEDDVAPNIRELYVKDIPGGAGNTALNLRALGADTFLASVVGQDSEAEKLTGALRNGSSLPGGTQGIAKERMKLVEDTNRNTTLKTRFVTERGRQLLRNNREHTYSISNKVCEQLIGALVNFAPTMIVVSDYAKGVVCRNLISGIRSTLPEAFIAVDPKQFSMDFYHDADLLKPNLAEFHKLIGVRAEGALDIDALVKHLKPVDRRQSSIDNILVTCGNGGGFLVTRGESAWSISRRFVVNKREVGDPSGCGDSSMAALVWALGAGWTLNEASELAFAAGACAYDHLGVRAVTRAELLKELETHAYDQH